jgi:hypothetical protein
MAGIGRDVVGVPTAPLHETPRLRTRDARTYQSVDLRHKAASARRAITDSIASTIA